MPERPKAIVLDFDGVVLQSVDVKTRSFAAVFAEEEPQAVRLIVEYHLRNGGLSRFEKFRWAYREVLRRPLPADEERRLGERFNALVEESVLKAEWVPGAREFLHAEHARRPLFIASGTPEKELRRIVEGRGLASLFRGVFGSPKRKDDILREIAAGLGCAPGALVMVGDARNDSDAAAAVGCRFIGICPAGQAHDFPAGTLVLPDLRDLSHAADEARAGR